MMDCPKFENMSKIFQGKIASGLEGKVIVKVKTIILDVNVIHINITTRRKVTKDQVFQKKEPWKNKSTVNWEEKMTRS
jgi:hypothetical protein